VSSASARVRIALQKEYVLQQVMCVTFTTMSMSADIAGVRRSFVPTCLSRRPAAVLVHPATIAQATRCSPCPSPPSPLTPPSLPPLTSRFDSFPTLCRWQGTQRWRDPVGTMGIPRVNRCARVFWGWRKYGRLWRKYGCVAKINNLYCTIPQSSAQRSGVACGSQRSAGGRRHR
jgi:hypothetical protein